MRNRFMRFMYGRNGQDNLSRLFTVLALILIVLSLIFSYWIYQPVGTALWILGVLCLIYAYVRMFSKQLGKRRDQNARYLALKSKIRTRITQSKDYKFFKCPQCKASMRVPRGKGKIRVTCHKCGNIFITKS